MTDKAMRPTSSELADIQTSIAQLTDLFRRRLMDDKVKAQTIEALTRQVSGLQLQPLCREFILMLDRLSTSDDDFVVSIREETLEVLSHYGLTTIEGTPAFDPTRQSIIGTVKSDELPDGAVAKVMKPGYLLNGVVLRPQAVIVAKHAASAPQQQATAAVPQPETAGNPPEPPQQ